MKTKAFGVRVPEDMLEDLECARRMVGAVSYAELLRDALKRYLADLSVITARGRRLKAHG